MEAIILAGLKLLEVMGQIYKTGQDNKWSDAWFKANEDIRAEKARWPNSDDRHLEELYDKRKSIEQAAVMAMNNLMAQVKK